MHRCRDAFLKGQFFKVKFFFGCILLLVLLSSWLDRTKELAKRDSYPTAHCHAALIEVFFTDDASLILVGLIDGSTQSVHASLFELNTSSVINALINAHNRGVEINLIINTNLTHDFFSVMEQSGIGIQSDNRSDLMQGNFFIFDKNTVLISSTNMVQSNQTHSNEVMVDKSNDLANTYEQKFDELWSGEFGVRLTSSE